MHLTPRAHPDGSPPAHRSGAHWVVAELDARGRIDRHAAMCIEFTIELALAEAATTVVIDLRDLASIEAPGLALLARARASCLSGGAQLELLLSSHESHAAIARALLAAGLGHQLGFTREAPVPAPPRPRLVRVL